MPPKTTRTGDNKKSGENRKAMLRCPQKGCGTSTDPMDATTSEVEETETISKPAKADATLQMESESSQAIKPKKVHSTPINISHQGHRSQPYTTNKETRIATKTLKLLQGMDNPNESPPKKEAYFGGSGLMDYICNSQKRKKGPQSHQTMQQMTANAPTSSMISIPVRTVPTKNLMVMIQI